MKTWSFYHAETGTLHHGKFAMTGDPESAHFREMLARNTPEGHVAIEGEYDHLSQRFDIASGAMVDYQPPQPSSDHEWNAATKRWRLKSAATARQQADAQARSRIADLIGEQHDHVRAFALDPTDTAARMQLLRIDAEIAQLRADFAQVP
jgi:hypothetical protein